jgi:DNA polymerase delta subunit 1
LGWANSAGSSKPFIRNVFTIDSCSQIVGAQVLEHKTQQSLLMAWKNFLLECDPDVMIGYNISNFDLPYLIDRASSSNVVDFPYLGRITRNKSLIKTTTFASKAFGQRDSKETSIDGRYVDFAGKLMVGYSWICCRSCRGIIN